MSNENAMGYLSEKLLAYTSTTLVHDFNYDIAVILLKNYSQLKNMSIEEVADLCYVSQASISRFCRFIGFKNFKEFKQSLEQDYYSVANDYSKQFYAMLLKDEEMALSTYRDELIQNIYSTITPDIMKIMPSIIKDIHDCQDVAYYSHYFLWDIGYFLSSKMMDMGKYIELFMSYDSQLESAKTLDGNSLAIVCSVGGTYTTRHAKVWNTIKRSGCKIVVITQNQSNTEMNSADYVLPCGISNHDNIGKYSAMMTLDYLVMSYLREYGKLIGEK